LFSDGGEIDCHKTFPPIDYFYFNEQLIVATIS
jgi:hypothetical protein